MTESQKRFLHEYLGEQWKGNITDAICERCGTVFSVNRTFTEPKDKQDLLEAIIKSDVWFKFESFITSVFWSDDNINDKSVMSWLILLSPEETAELICKWKVVE